MQMIGDCSSEQSRDVSLYFHIPFCSRKCPYCHFFVLPDKPSLKKELLFALRLEWNLRLPLLRGKKIVSLYFGGGTPSKLSPDQLASILSLVIESGLEIDPACEITLEANPEDASLPLFTAYRSLGVNRLSLGIQSFDDQQLKIIGRGHSSQRGLDAIQIASEAGFTNISVDLMYDLPHQTLASWKGTLHRLCQLPITHLSLYNLTIEPHTAFNRQKQALEPHLPTPEASLALLQQGIEAIEEIGLSRYEISAFARPGFHSRHNTGYWTARPFLGLGPSAFSYWEGKRFQNAPHFQRYGDALKKGIFPLSFEEELTFPHHLFELFAIRIRLTEGIDLGQFERVHGSLPPEFHTLLTQLQQKGWVQLDSGKCSLTEQGMLFYDSVASELI
jgi:oxygen-independent coproporphyrinogen-3 oxidase